MRIAFAGTPEFARVALERLAAAGHEVALVLTQPDRPAGRGMKLMPSPVKALALERGWPLAQPHGLRLDGRHGADAAEARERLQVGRHRGPGGRRLRPDPAAVDARPAEGTAA